MDREARTELLEEGTGVDLLEPGLRRRDVYRGAVVDGRELRGGVVDRARLALRRALTSRAERDEAKLDGALAAAPTITRSNTIAVLSPKGGVGKTTCTFLIGNLLAGRLQARCLAIDANPDFGTLAALAPDGRRTRATLADVLTGIRDERISSSAELMPYVSPLSSGLHLLAAPERADAMAAMTPDAYGELLAFLGRFYEVILLDLGTGITDPIARFAVTRADQTVLVTTPEWVTANTVLGALGHLEGVRAANLVTVLNQAQAAGACSGDGIADEFRRREISRLVTIPYSERLRTMLDSGTYTLGGLERDVRMPIKRLGLAVASALV